MLIVEGSVWQSFNICWNSFPKFRRNKSKRGHCWHNWMASAMLITWLSSRITYHSYRWKHQSWTTKLHSWGWTSTDARLRSWNWMRRTWSGFITINPQDSYVLTLMVTQDFYWRDYDDGRSKQHLLSITFIPRAAAHCMSWFWTRVRRAHKTGTWPHIWIQRKWKTFPTLQTFTRFCRKEKLVVC